MTKNWRSCKQRWENYATVAKLAAQPEQFKIALFLHCSGAEALKVHNGLSFDSESCPESWRNLMSTRSAKLMKHTRYVFNSQNQAATQSIEAHITELRKLMKTCNFCDCLKDTFLRDRTGLGVSSKHLRKRLLQKCKLTKKVRRYL